jgi:hypothetical protein
MQQTIAERIEAVSKLQKLDLDWKHTSRLGLKILLFGDQVSLTDDGDFVDLKEIQDAIRYLAEQFNVEVKSGKTKKS